MQMPVTVHNLDELLAKSSATIEFKKDAEALETGNSVISITFNRQVPPVKALRAVMKLLEFDPALEINHVQIEATSGCSDFVGQILVNGGEAKFDFIWDCAWRAKQENYVDHFGYPDQIRAAREFKYQCFKKFERVQ